MPYLVNLSFGKDPDSLLDSRDAVDHYRSHIAKQVTTGQILAHLEPLSDNDFETRPPGQLIIQNKADILSRGVELSKNEKQTSVISNKNGFPSFNNNKISVTPNLIIDGDINFRTGNIDCPGDLLIKGTIMSGFKVKAENLTVTGNIENAEVECSGDLVCSGGIVACQDFPLLCGANLWCKYLENSHIEVKKNIFIAGSSLHSFLKAGNSIVLCQSSAVLVGGKSEAGNSFYSGSLGAKWATPTEIILGCEPFLAKKLADHRVELAKLETELNDLNERVDQINIFLQHKEGQTTPHEAHHLQEERELVESKLSFVMQKHKTFLNKFKDLEKQVADFKMANRNCTLHVSNQLFSGVRLTIKDAEYRTQEESLSTVVIMQEQDGEIIKLESTM